MEASDKNILLGELTMIKEEDAQTREEELEIKHEPLFLYEMEEVYSHGEKRPLSPTFPEVTLPSKRHWPDVDDDKCENDHTVTYFNSCRSSSTGSEQHISISGSAPGGQVENNQRNMQLLTTQTKQVVMKVYDYFRNRNQLLSEVDLQIKVAAATGISVRTVQRIKKQASEGRLHSPPPVRIRSCPVIDSLDDNAEGCTRREILSFYERGEVPTLDTLLEAVREPTINFQGGRSSLGKIVKKIGFRYVKVAGGRRILMEKEDIVASRCNFLRILANNRNSSNPCSEVYIDETFLYQKVSGRRTGEKLKTAKEVKYIVVHAGGEKGFVPGSLLMLRPRTNTKGHYKEAMMPQCFQVWFKDQLLPNIPDNSLIIMDSSSSHSKIANEVPNRCMKKYDIIRWLEERNIAHDKDVSKSELLYLVNSNKEKLRYEIDEIAHELGHVVLRLPPHHDHLNPMGLIWQQVKSEIENKSFQADEAPQTVEELIRNAVNSVTEKDWWSCIQHTRKMEDEYKNKDKAVDHMLEKMTIKYDESASDEED